MPAATTIVKTAIERITATFMSRILHPSVTGARALDLDEGQLRQ